MSSLGNPLYKKNIAAQNCLPSTPPSSGSSVPKGLPRLDINEATKVHLVFEPLVINKDAPIHGHETVNKW